MTDRSKHGRAKTCACCGGYAGVFVQWWNQDDGFGICARCTVWLRKRGHDEDYLNKTYGVAGCHRPITLSTTSKT